METYHLRVFTHPIQYHGEVVRGFGRGSKELGIATANLDDASTGKMLIQLRSALRNAKQISGTNGVNGTDGEKKTNGHHNGHEENGGDESEECSGVYYGVGRIGSTEKIYRAAISVGRNPHYGNVNNTCETHLIDYTPGEDVSLYGQPIHCILLGKLRDQKAYKSLEELRQAIFADIDFCRTYINQNTLEDLSTLLLP